MKIKISPNHDLVLHRSILRKPIDKFRTAVLGHTLQPRNRTLGEELRPAEIRRRPPPLAPIVPTPLPVINTPIAGTGHIDGSANANTLAQTIITGAMATATPQPTPLTRQQIAADNALRSFKPSTTISDPTPLGRLTTNLPPVYRFAQNEAARYIASDNYSTNEADRQAFRAAFVAHAGGYPDNNQRRFDQYVADIQALQRLHPDLAAIPTYDLVAVRGLTSGDHRYLNRPLKILNDPDALPEARDEAKRTAEKFRPYLNAVVSGLNQLPPHVGIVYRGYNDDRLYTAGDPVNFGFLASTSKRIDRAFNGDTRYEIQSVTGKDISRISLKPREEEVTFVRCQATVTTVVPNPPSGGDRYARKREVKLRENAPQYLSPQ